MKPLQKVFAMAPVRRALNSVRQALYPVLVIVALSCAAPVQADVSLKFGMYASEKPTLLVGQFRPLLNYLEQAMRKDLAEPVTIEFHVASSYDGCIKKLAEGEVDFARLGPASFLKAKQMTPGIEVLALENDGGDKVFQGVIFSRADSGLKRLIDLKGKRFAFGDPNSTAGRYLSQLSLKRAGVRASDLAGYEYLGRHDRVAEAVWSGEFAAGAVKEDVFERMQKEGRAVQLLARMKNVTGPWAARAGISPSVLASLRRTLLGMHDPAVLAAFGKEGFLPFVAGDLDLVSQAIHENEQFFR